MPRANRTVLREVSLEINAGEVTTLLGPNGVGKSTLVLAVAGVLRPTAGRILLGDEDLTRRRPARSVGPGWRSCPRGGGSCPS